MAFEEANDAIASEQSIFSENQDCIIFLHVTINSYMYVPSYNYFGVQIRMVAEK